MNKMKRLLLVVVLLATALLLTSCGGDKRAKSVKPESIVANESTQVVFADFEATQNEDRVEDLTIYLVLHSGNLQKLSLGKATSVTYYGLDDNSLPGWDADSYKREFSYDVKHEWQNSKKDHGVFTSEYVFTQYNSNLSSAAKDKFGDLPMGVVSDAVSFTAKGVPSSGLVVRDSYVPYEGNGLTHFTVNTDGTLKDIDNVNIKYNNFFSEDELIVDKKYINYIGRDLEIVITLSNGFEYTTTTNNSIWFAQGAVPLNPKTASFWNWIFLQMPIAYLMSFIGKITGNSFAVAILLTTIIVRTLAWPIYAKTNDMSMKMAVAQPDIDKLNRKYAARKDPESQQKMQMEMMAIYKKHKINMFGCLLPILQMPIFFAMYEVVRRITIPGGPFSANVVNTQFFWTDLTSGGTIAKLGFTALVGITMFALQKVSAIKPSYAKTTTPAPKANANAPQTEQTMKIVSYVMIFMMIMTAYITPGYAISFYWIIGNLYAIGQTLFNRVLNEKKHAKLQEEQLYGRSREIIDAEFKKKGDK